MLLKLLLLATLVSLVVAQWGLPRAIDAGPATVEQAYAYGPQFRHAQGYGRVKPNNKVEPIVGKRFKPAH